MITRRSFFTLLAAPAIVHAGNLMPVRALEQGFAEDLNRVSVEEWLEPRIFTRMVFHEGGRWELIDKDQSEVIRSVRQDMLEKTL